MATSASLADACSERTSDNRTVPVELLDSVGRRLPDVRGQVGRRLLYGQHHDGDDYRHPDAGQNPECAGPDELVWVLPRKHRKKSCFSAREDDFYSLCSLQQKHFTEHEGWRLFASFPEEIIYDNKIIRFQR